MARIIYFDFQKRQKTGDCPSLVLPVDKSELSAKDKERREKIKKNLLAAAEKLKW